MNIELITYAQVESVEGDPGHYRIRVRKRARSVSLDLCTGCGDCINVCPVNKKGRTAQRRGKQTAAGTGRWMAAPQAIYVPYAQATPNVPAIDRSQCLFFKTGKCKICVKKCPVQAIDHDQTDEVVELEAGAIILSSGSEPYDPNTYDIYGYSRHPNVMTSLEFEQMLSASGPTGGHVMRPSDQRPPRKIAWLQCVGSRDTHPGAGQYCSTVCCSYAIKEAIVAKEHIPGLDTVIFYIDIRTQGKDFETYLNNARNNIGVRFIKSRIAEVSQDHDKDKLRITYIDHTGRRHEEAFDMAVQSVGITRSPQALDLAGKLGIELDVHGFPVTSSFEPVRTSRPNIMVCGTAHSPQDIPASVVNANAAVNSVATALADARWSVTHTQEEPVEQDIQGLVPRIGVFVCHCGTNIASVVDVEAVAAYARDLPYVVYSTTNLFSCSQDSQQGIAEAIRTHRLNRVVVAACSPRTHEAIFQETMKSTGLNKFLFEMANIRNHCSWVHAKEHEAATEKSIDLVRMAVEKAALMQPLAEQQIEVNQQVLVIGGGLAGLTAAKNLAEQSFTTHLVEKEDRLGGLANTIFETWKSESVSENLQRLIGEVQDHPDIHIHLGTQVKEVKGSKGRFKSTLIAGDHKTEVDHGAAIIATGALEYKPREHLYGMNSNVHTALELEAMINAQETWISEPGSIAFLLCVGSRNPERPYCSKVCCTHVVKNALRIKARNPDMNIYILYRDMRTYGLRERLYRLAREKGIHFLRFDIDLGIGVEELEGPPRITVTDQVLNRKVTLQPDRLVLATGVVPPDNSAISKLFKVSLNADGFFAEAHAKLRPVDFSTEGVFVCGLAHGPKPIDESIAQGQAAASRAAAMLCKPTMRVGGMTAEIETQFCTGCGVCEAVCPYGAIAMNAQQRAEVDPALCKGCGLCSASCRSGAAGVHGFTNAEIFSQLCALK